MSPSSSDPKTISPDDALPPVEPPSASFIVQLFIIPAVIVTLIALVWLLFSWTAFMRVDADSYVEALGRDNEARWQAAAALAEILNNPRYAELKTDPKLASQLASKLDAELETGGMSEEDVTLRIFLCRALGEFRVPDVLPVLVKAAGRDKSEEVAARRAALEAIALLATQLPREQLLGQKDLLPTIERASEDDEPVIRSSAAFALGVIDAPAASERLAVLLHDAYPDVRYNAATALARKGDPRVVETLVEMLDPEEDISTKNEEQAARDAKHASIAINALRAVDALHKQNPRLDMAPLREAIDRLMAAPISEDVRMQAKATERAIQPIQAELP